MIFDKAYDIFKVHYQYKQSTKIIDFYIIIFIQKVNGPLLRYCITVQRNSMLRRILMTNTIS